MGTKEYLKRQPYADFFKCAKSAFIKPYPDELASVAEERPSTYDQYEVYPEDIFTELAEVLRNKCTDERVNLCKDFEVRRIDIAKVVVNFTDLSEPIYYHPELLDSARRAAVLINEIEDRHEETGQRIGLSEQLRLSLKISNGNFPRSLLDLTLATRQAAKSCDNHIFSEAEVDKDSYRFSKRRMREWKNIPKAFSFSDGNNNAVSDVYHFWGSATAGYARECGMSSNEGFRPLDRFKTQISDKMYYLQARLTNVRYRITGDTGETHEPSDIMGYEFGRGLYLFLKEELRQ